MKMEYKCFDTADQWPIWWYIYFQEDEKLFKVCQYFCETFVISKEKVWQKTTRLFEKATVCIVIKWKGFCLHSTELLEKIHFLHTKNKLHSKKKYKRKRFHFNVQCTVNAVVYCGSSDWRTIRREKQLKQEQRMMQK